jgi:hypothetical protein
MVLAWDILFNGEGPAFIFSKTGLDTFWAIFSLIWSPWQRYSKNHLTVCS